MRSETHVPSCWPDGVTSTQQLNPWCRPNTKRHVPEGVRCVSELLTRPPCANSRTSRSDGGGLSTRAVRSCLRKTTNERIDATTSSAASKKRSSIAIASFLRESLRLLDHHHVEGTFAVDHHLPDALLVVRPHVRPVPRAIGAPDVLKARRLIPGAVGVDVIDTSDELVELAARVRHRRSPSAL